MITISVGCVNEVQRQAMCNIINNTTPDIKACNLDSGEKVVMKCDSSMEGLAVMLAVQFSILLDGIPTKFRITSRAVLDAEDSRE